MNESNATAKAPATGMSQGSQMRITEIERDLIRRTFQGNEDLLLLLRKIFLPEIDPKAPIGQGIDLWMTTNVKEMSPDMAYVNILARNQLIMHVDQQLMTLNVIANMKQPVVGDAVAKLKADGNK